MVSIDSWRLSLQFSQRTYLAAYTLFTPNKSGQRLSPTYYRGCWHVVSRGLFPRYRPCSSLGKAVYTPKSVLLHAALLHQGCPHCGKFLTAASRRSRDRVSVPLWPFILSDWLRIIALVSHYLTNKLIRLIPIN